MTVLGAVAGCMMTDRKRIEQSKEELGTEAVEMTGYSIWKKSA
jgi:hypothetical protein